jgi:hypothetical protein
MTTPEGARAEALAALIKAAENVVWFDWSDNP